MYRAEKVITIGTLKPVEEETRYRFSREWADGGQFCFGCKGESNRHRVRSKEVPVMKSCPVGGYREARRSIVREKVLQQLA